MGLAASHLQAKCTGLGWAQPSPPQRRDADDQPGSVLVGLPADIVVYMARRMAPESAAALSLTCKNLFHLVFPVAGQQMCESAREGLLLLLEKDLGDRMYYCQLCIILHPFAKSSGPATCEEWKFGPSDCRLGHAYHSGALTTNIYYHHVRLVMNRHLLGRRTGLPLDRLNFAAHLYEIPGTLQWLQSWEAKIIADELFLSGTHTIRADNAKELRIYVDKTRHGVCNHLATDGETWHLSRIPEVARYQNSSVAGLFVPCRNIASSCDVCYTDFVVTIEWQNQGGEARQDKGRWAITIVSYHALGKGRSLGDPKWQAFQNVAWSRHAAQAAAGEGGQPSAGNQPAAASPARSQSYAAMLEQTRKVRLAAIRKGEASRPRLRTDKPGDVMALWNKG